MTASLLARALAAVPISLLASMSSTAAGQTSGLPQIVARDGPDVLLVEGAPYLMLGAQANNSTNYPAMQPKFWRTTEQLHANRAQDRYPVLNKR